MGYDGNVVVVEVVVVGDAVELLKWKKASPPIAATTSTAAMMERVRRTIQT
jgi:hypothetical protein